MFVEQRTYTLIPTANVSDYLRIYKDTGALALQRKILGNLLGYYVTEFGMLNTLVHLWGYSSLEERTRRRQLLSQEPAWQDYLAQVRPMIQQMENRIMVPTDFSPGGQP
ncbi:NIPSNAP family protein [Orrella marina]|uniref:NIPSNAP family protein n=1 Tax=Orrella marina TaxID=2163011 RepID=A0A2R4XH75_9BURK|nr:NIPSNAP family protein [Orrella marina]AWB33165.1 NIPSNAP family protein [Orrella marina]